MVDRHDDGIVLTGKLLAAVENRVARARAKASAMKPDDDGPVTWIR